MSWTWECFSVLFVFKLTNFIGGITFRETFANGPFLSFCSRYRTKNYRASGSEMKRRTSCAKRELKFAKSGDRELEQRASRTRRVSGPWKWSYMPRGIIELSRKIERTRKRGNWPRVENRSIQVFRATGTRKPEAFSTSYTKVKDWKKKKKLITVAPVTFRSCENGEAL